MKREEMVNEVLEGMKRGYSEEFLNRLLALAEQETMTTEEKEETAGDKTPAKQEKKTRKEIDREQSKKTLPEFIPEESREFCRFTIGWLLQDLTRTCRKNETYGDIASRKVKQCFNKFARSQEKYQDASLEFFPNPRKIRGGETLYNVKSLVYPSGYGLEWIETPEGEYQLAIIEPVEAGVATTQEKGKNSIPVPEFKGKGAKTKKRIYAMLDELEDDQKERILHVLPTSSRAGKKEIINQLKKLLMTEKKDEGLIYAVKKAIKELEQI